MIINFASLLLISFVTVQLSDEFPIDMLQSYQESQSIQEDGSTFNKEKEPANSVPEEFDDEDEILLNGEGKDEGSEGEQDLQELSPNTADTMRKINPLTIADQVSQMFRKGSQKVNIANKSAGMFRTPDRSLRGQETQGDQSLAMSMGSEGEDSPIQPGYLRQGVPNIVNKPRSNDYGYSVIVLAGDAVHLPIKVKGKPVRGQGRGTPEDKDVPINVYRTGEAERKSGVEEGPSKKEVRVYKQFSKNPDFPVYDEDFNFVPDPFQGILDDNYRIELSKSNQPPVSVDSGMALHRVHIRSDNDAGYGDKAECGSWGKHNATESGVISLYNMDSSNIN